MSSLFDLHADDILTEAYYMVICMSWELVKYKLPFLTSAIMNESLLQRMKARYRQINTSWNVCFFQFFYVWFSYMMLICGSWDDVKTSQHLYPDRYKLWKMLNKFPFCNTLLIDLVIFPFDFSCMTIIEVVIMYDQIVVGKDRLQTCIWNFKSAVSRYGNIWNSAIRSIEKKRIWNNILF